MDEKKLQEVFSDEAFVQSLFEMDTAQEVQAALNEKGVAFTLEEIEAFKQQLTAKSGEMNEEDLDSVAGGLNIFLPGHPLITPHFPPGAILPRKPHPRW